ncbi:DUF3021 domain-containing protein [Bacillus sp. FJAT-52991]|uniref:DUF3021 domain-containing protein n=1 Tax=Bacillus kandeliae TaxID=3129297 RepID=A0ABZ2N9Y9_9BACI
MGIEAVKRGLAGLGFGAVITFIALTALDRWNIDISLHEIWVQMLASLAIGGYFGIASLIFDIEKWSPLKQTASHFCLSVIAFYPIALTIGWIPLQFVAIFASLMIFILVYVFFWICFRWYFKRMERALNASIKNER